MNSKSHQKNTVAKDQTENRQQHYKSMARISICQPFSNKEFFSRQRLYDDLYNTNQIKCESQHSFSLEKGIKQSKYKDIVESAKLKYAQSPNNINSIIKLQQNSITDIVEQLRNQKKANNVKLKNNADNLKKHQQLNLNLILIIAIPLLCFLVVIFEIPRIEGQNTN